MNAKLVTETDFYPAICSKEEYEQGLQENRNVEDKFYRSMQFKRFLIRCSAWAWFNVSLIGLIFFENLFVTFSSLFFIFLHLLILKFGYHHL